MDNTFLDLYNNSLEGNNPKLRKAFKWALSQLKETDRLKTTAALAIKALQFVIPKLSEEIVREALLFETGVEISSEIKASARELALHEDFLQVPDTEVFVCRQYGHDGNLKQVTTEDYNEVLRLHRDGDMEWTYEEFKLLASLRIINDDGCFPCHDFGRGPICYHFVARKYRLDQHDYQGPDCDKLQASKKKGRPRVYARRKGGFKRTVPSHMLEWVLACFRT